MMMMMIIFMQMTQDRLSFHNTGRISSSDSTQLDSFSAGLRTTLSTRRRTLSGRPGTEQVQQQQQQQFSESQLYWLSSEHWPSSFYSQAVMLMMIGVHSLCLIGLIFTAPGASLVRAPSSLVVAISARLIWPASHGRRFKLTGPRASK